MAFWGTQIAQSKPYIHHGHAYDGRLRMTQATLGLSSKSQSRNDKVVVLCKQGNANPIALCTLIPEEVETQKIELEFNAKEEIVISVNGNRSVHLSGYYSRHGHFKTDEDDLDSPGEDIAETESKESSNYNSDEDDYDSSDSFINDSDPEKLTPWPGPKIKTRGEFSVQLTPKFPDFGRKKKTLKKEYEKGRSLKPSLN